jgi:hypothetical protein
MADTATVKRFRSDPASGELLWFPTPAVAVPPPKPTLHTLDYLYHQAMKQRQGGKGKRTAEEMSQ